MELYKDYEYEVGEVNKIGKEQQKIKEIIQHYEHKRNENEMVQGELKLVDEGDEIYKLIGPILVKQDTSEALMNVEKRLDYFTSEIKRQDNFLKEKETLIEQKKKKIQNLQDKLIDLSKRIQQQQQQQQQNK